MNTGVYEAQTQIKKMSTSNNKPSSTFAPFPIPFYFFYILCCYQNKRTPPTIFFIKDCGSFIIIHRCSYVKIIILLFSIWILEKGGKFVEKYVNPGL